MWYSCDTHVGVMWCHMVSLGVMWFMYVYMYLGCSTGMDGFMWIWCKDKNFNLFQPGGLPRLPHRPLSRSCSVHYSRTLPWHWLNLCPCDYCGKEIWQTSSRWLLPAYPFKIEWDLGPMHQFWLLGNMKQNNQSVYMYFHTWLHNMFPWQQCASPDCMHEVHRTHPVRANISIKLHSQ